MARKPPAYISPKFFIHYDKKTGEIFSASNEPNTVHSTVEISETEYIRFLNGENRFYDYQVGYIRTADNQTVLAVSPRANQGYTFKNNVFEWITDAPNKKTELTVVWDSLNSQWIFSLSDACKDRLKENMSNEILPFFIMLANDFDFLIRTISISMQDLCAFKEIKKPFESRIEKDIKKISIASSIVFQSYGLKIND
jgi:hypothetical protein